MVAIDMGAGLRSPTSLAEDYVSPPKYKSSLLHRYLNDSLHHVVVANAIIDTSKRKHSGSFSSNEYDDELLSPSSSEPEANFVYHSGKEPHLLHSLPLRVSLTHTTSLNFVLFWSPATAHLVLIPSAGSSFLASAVSFLLYYTTFVFSHCFIKSYFHLTQYLTDLFPAFCFLLK